MSPIIVLWELPDRLICGDENGQLVIIRTDRAGAVEPIRSSDLKCIRCSPASLDVALQIPGRGMVAVPMSNALIDGYLIRCAWVPELRTWIVAGEPKQLPSSHN